MSQPQIARLPVVLLEHREGGGVTVSTWQPPSGIWQQLQGGQNFDTYDEGRSYAVQIAHSLAGFLAVDCTCHLQDRQP